MELIVTCGQTVSFQKKEVNPWWKLDLGESKIIMNVFVDLRDDDAYHQPDVKKRDMSGLTVYVDDISDSVSSGHTLCENKDSSFDDAKTRQQFQCILGTKGRYIHVLLASSTAIHLALCEVFLNWEGKMNFFYLKRVLPSNVCCVYLGVYYPSYTAYKGEYYLVQPREDPYAPFSRAIDDDAATCASTKQSSTFQSVSIRFPWPLYIVNLLLYVNIKSGATYSLSAGAHLSNNGSDNYEELRVRAAEDKRLAAFPTSTIEKFVKDISIQAKSSNPIMLEVCELQIGRWGKNIFSRRISV